MRNLELEDAIIAESARWGDYRRDVHQYSNGPYELYTKTDFWLPELVDIDSYLLAKETNAIYHFKSLSPPLYPFIEPPVFKIDSVEQSGGYVTIPCTFDMLSDNYGIDEIHYTLDGTDPREYWTGDVCQTATLYDGMPIELNTTMTVKARTKIGPCWSALHEALYVDDSICDSLRITEIMYHPVDADAEFLELKNIGLNTINLNGVQFTQGIEHTFGDVTVDPNGYVLIVRDKSAFEAYYTSIPENAPVIQWDSGALANSQEEIKWNNGLGQTIQLFTYQDKWYDQTDGQGFSLTIRDPLGATYLWDQKNGWRSSLYVGGSPGQTEDIQ